MQIMEKTAESEAKRLWIESLRRSDQAFCPLCQKPVKLLPFSQAADFFKTDVQHISRLAQKTGLHRLHNRKGIVMICGDSLFQLLNNRQRLLSNPGFISSNL